MPQAVSSKASSKLPRSSRLMSVLRLLKNNFSLRPSNIFFLTKHALTLWLLNIETRHQFRENYGDFNWDRDCRPHRILNQGSEGGAIIGDVVFLAKTTDVGVGSILLAGDRNEVKKLWKPIFPDAEFYTAGMHEMDYQWDYEQAPPADLAAKRFDLIISQAMIEHLIDPPQHVRDLAGLLAPGGCLVVHSVLPGFFYHRFPVDCFRFYPDWFEVMAQRLGLEVVDKQISVFHITYKLRRPD